MLLPTKSKNSIWRIGSCRFVPLSTLCTPSPNDSTCPYIIPQIEDENISDVFITTQSHVLTIEAYSLKVAFLVNVYEVDTGYLYNCSWTKFIAIIVNVLVYNYKRIAIIVTFLCTFFAWQFCDFLREHSLTSQVTFHAFVLHFWVILLRSVKLVANIKSVAALQQKGPDRRVDSASGYGSRIQWFESRRG